MTKLKAFVNDKLNISKMTSCLCDRVENTVGKEENAGYQHFLLFPQFFSKAFPHCFPKPFSLGSLKVWIAWYRVNQVIPFKSVGNIVAMPIYYLSAKTLVAGIY